MTVDNIISFALAQSFSTSGQLTTSAIDLCNIAYHDVENAIIEWIGDDFFYEYIKADTVANQWEYILPVSDATTKWFKKVLSAEIKRATDDTSYSLLTNSKNTNYGVGLASLGSNLSKNTWIYDIKDGSLFIYPTPLNSVTDWLKVQVIQNLIDLVVWGAETLVFPWHTELRQRHHVIWLAMIPYIFAEKWLYDDRANAEIRYKNELDKMIRAIGNRYRWTSVWQLPNLSFYTR